MKVRFNILLPACLGLAAYWTAIPGFAAPDLKIIDLDRSSLVTDGQTLVIGGSLKFKLANAGTDAAAHAFTVTVFEDTNLNAAFDPGTDSVLGSAAEAATPAAGASAARSVAMDGSVRFKGNLIYVFADSAHEIAESDETNNLANTGSLSSLAPPSPGPLSPVVEWHWLPPAGDAFPGSANVMMTPVVIDLQGDGVPEVVFGSTASTGGGYVEVGQLRAIRGTDGSALFTVSDPALFINVASSMAAGDIDDDGRPEIIACDSSGVRLIAFEHDGTFKWRSPNLEAVYWGAPAIADLDQNGVPEIVIGRQVLRNDGTLLWSGGGGRGNQGGVGALSLVADVNLDGSPDVVAGNTVYGASGALLYQLAALPDGYNAVANFDADPNPEIVLVSNGSVWLLEHTLVVKWGPVAIPGGGAGGPPTIADYDGDGQAEIGVAGASRYAVLETNGTLKWAAVSQDGSSNRSGSSVFDFEGDGKAEVLYRDELKLRVYNGTDGAVLFETPMSSCTWYEYVLVADVDGDGKAEIVAVANNNCGYGPQRGVWSFGDAADKWVATRKVWNQHTYHITNVNPDGTIPAVELNNWQQAGLNNYRLNTFAPDEPEPLSAPDLVPSYLRFDTLDCPHSVDITARVGNGGSLVAPARVLVSFYLGDPAAGGTLIGTAQTLAALEPGESEDVSLAWLAPPPGAQTVFVRADDDGTGLGSVVEGFEDNNVHGAISTLCATTCDLDLDRDIDSADISLILGWRGKAVPPAPAAADVDNNRYININDARGCTLKCTRPKCATR